MPGMGEWSSSVKVAAHEALRELFDGAAGNGSMAIYDDAGLLLAQVQMDRPCGTVSAQGVLSLAFLPATAQTEGVPSYATLFDSAGNPHTSLPCVEGDNPVPGSVVFDSLQMVPGFDISIVSAEIG